MNNFGIFPNSRIQLQIEHLNSLSSYVQEFRRNCLLVIDRAGSGKTNLVCDFALSLATKQPVLLLFGKENFHGTDGIIEKLESLISHAFDVQSSSPISLVDELLEKEGLFLHIFLEGVNENRSISELDVNIATFLQWASNHRIRVTITCRDIYWVFCSGPLKLDSRNRQNYSSEIGDHYDEKENLQTPIESPGCLATS